VKDKLYMTIWSDNNHCFGIPFSTVKGARYPDLAFHSPNLASAKEMVAKLNSLLEGHDREDLINLLSGEL
jgi:hypothetical protein